jgi:copper chaperone
MMELKVEAMSCNHCVAVITETVKALDPQAKVEVDLAAHKVHVETDRAREAVAGALAEAGYPVSD